MNIPDLDLNPTPNEGKTPNIVSIVSGAGSGGLNFHLNHDNYYVGSMEWNSNYGYWRVSCDYLQTEDMYILIRRVQAHILQHDPEVYHESGLPVDPDTATLDVDWWNENREKVFAGLKSKG